MQKKIINISADGSTVKTVYDDRLRGLMDHGEASITRASHVEPGDPKQGQDPTRWYADLSPIHGPTMGPFDERQAALDAEVDWLNKNLSQA